ncbi:AraC family transcriptional regulator [Paenibacillus ginsengarvi]|uniref:AraC family transcriptional regulator n=1 Tax=Paenibacillus ginsengarvi TaxID=400777 RepID=A0A3B0APF5_9BACL|nr:AraC family transcriptional regulator [Paenibacillus ginsengarvi]RKN62081.1 AraC family transcriptional regulator [Paenibacillus ginsengarvi]
MQCLELAIPPLPQLIIVAHTVWKRGALHAPRSFGLYDVLFVKRGTLFMMEDDRSYEIKAGHMLVLEPNRQHRGYKPCEEETELIWLHFAHPPASRLLESGQVPWSRPCDKKIDRAFVAPAQQLYIPKFGELPLQTVWPFLSQLASLYGILVARQSANMHALFAALLDELQTLLYAGPRAPGTDLADRIEAYLRDHYVQPFDADHMAAALHFDADYVSRCLKKHTGMSALQYVHHLRIEKAQELLRTTELSVQQIADATGFGDATYLIRQFRSKTGMTPKRYRLWFQRFI